MYKRDYSKEWEKEKERVTVVRAKVDKEKAKKFKERIEKDVKNISEFINEKIDEYLKQ